MNFSFLFLFSHTLRDVSDSNLEKKTRLSDVVCVIKIPLKILPPPILV